MRLWSIHPKYLDSKGLVACWREGLLALAVSKGATKGYKNHPQLDRFYFRGRLSILHVNNYLHFICDEADARGYNFDRSKLFAFHKDLSYIPVTVEQVKYEWSFLKSKVRNRTENWNFEEDANIEYRGYGGEKYVHPMFYVIPGEIESWEKVKEIGS